jgi:dTDP-glucose 4,6-dehydratase
VDMRVVVTGGAGFIGSSFVAQILENPLLPIKELVVIDNLTYAGNLRNIEDSKKDTRLVFHKGDISDRNFVASILQESDFVVNFAAESHVDNSINSSEIFMRTNILGTHSLLEVGLEKGIKRFLQVSTDEVYGSIDEGSWKEDFPLSPNSPYAASKASADLLVRAFHNTYGLDTVVTRCSNNYGPKQFPEKLIPVVINSIIRGRSIPVYGKGVNVRDWLHVSDHCSGIELALFNGVAGEVYNIGGGTELSNITIINKIIEIMGDGKSLISFVTDRKGHDLRYSVNWSKIKGELNYSPVFNFQEGLTQTVNWYIKNLDSWWPNRISTPK